MFNFYLYCYARVSIFVWNPRNTNIKFIHDIKICPTITLFSGVNDGASGDVFLQRLQLWEKRRF